MYICAGTMARQDNDTLETCNLAVLQQTFAVNTYGPLLLVQALLPNLERSNMAKIGMVSSRVCSINDNSSGGSYAYRASKAALNSLSKSLSIDLKDKNIPVVVLHPGLVRTNMDPKNWEIEEAVNPDEAAEKLWKVYQSKGIEDTGKFWHREGQELPW
jgi:NAD(P)-dependent dehydrogenase (short-subunit alcohol dehydrogenase family)